MKEKLYEEKGPYYMEDWCEQAADSIENGSVKGDLYGGYSYALTINGEDAETFFQSPDVKELILRDISYPVKDGHASYSGLDEIVGYYSSLNFRDPDVQEDLIKLGFDEEEVKSLAMYQGADSAKDEEIECWIDYDINLDDSNVENEEDGVWEVDGFTYDTEEEARAGYKQAIDTEPSSDHILMYGNEEIEYYDGIDSNEEVDESYPFSKNPKPVCKDKHVGGDDPTDADGEAVSESNDDITELEAGSEIKLKDGRIVNIIGKAYGSGGVQCGYKVYDVESGFYDEDDPEEVMFDEIESVSSINESIKDYLPRGGFMRDDEDDKSSHKTGAWFGQGTDDQIRKAKIIAKVKFAQGDRFGRVTKDDLDDFENYKEAYEEMFGPVELDEGWKDNLKRAAGVAAVAGGLMAGNAHAANIHDPYDDRAPHPEQSELYKDAVYVNQYEDKVIDKNGNEWTMNQWADMVAGEDPYDDNDYPPEFTDDEEELNESHMITEGTGNFDMFEDSPNLAFTNEEIENIDLEGDLFSSRNLPSWFEDYSRGNYPIHMVESTLDDEFAFIGARSGYYEGMNIGIVKNNEFEEWAYNNYDEANGMYYEYGSEDEITPEELKALFDKRVEEEYQKGIETLKYIKEKWGGRFINVAWRASNGETGYEEDKTLNEAEDPTENTEEPAQKPEGDTKGHPISDFPINDTDVKIDDIKVRDSAWEELDLSGVMKAIDAEDAKATLGGDTAENTNISLRTSTAKSTTAEMKPSENKKQEKSKEPEIDKKDQKDRIDGAEKTKADIHEGFEFKFNEEVLKEADNKGDVITFEITNSDGFPCVVEVTNKSSGRFTADELKEVIEKENPTIWFNDADARYWFMDFSYEKDGKTYWISSDNIEGDMSKYELSIYDGGDYGNDDDDKKLNEAQITGENSPSGIDFLKTLDEKGRYMFLSKMQADCKYFLDGHEYNKFLWAGNVEDQIKYMKWLYNSFPKNKKPEWISMEEIEDYEKRMAGKGKEDHSRDEIDEQMLDEGVGSRGMIKAIEKAFNDGRYGRYGKWECGLGGYDTGYQVSYEHIPFFEIKEDDTVKFLSNNLMKRKTGYTPQDIIDILSEIGDYTMTSESDDEELDESYDANKNIYNPSLILQAYDIEHNWYESEGKGDNDQLPEIMVFVINGDDIVDTKRINRNEIGSYKGNDNEYVLFRNRDSGLVLTDYDLMSIDNFVKYWNNDYYGNVDESARLSELASKMVLREADESSVAKVKINSVKFEGKEGAQDDKNWVEGKTYSFEEFQKLVYEYDYAVWNQADRMGYDKLWYSADITVDYNGKQEHIGYDGRLDLGDGKYGKDSVSVAFMVKHGVAKDLGIDVSQVQVVNPEVPYDSETYAGKYGKYEDNLDKFIADRTAEIKTPKYARRSDNITTEEIEVGDFFRDGDMNQFYRVTRRTKSSVWLEKVKSKTISTPYKNRGELDYQNNAYPTDEKDDSDRWSWFDLSKPFRLSDYGSYVLASQGRHYLSFWGGKELAESFEPKGEMLEAGNEQPFENPFKEGDILYSSWGYTMRLVDFYKVLSASKSFVKLAHLADYNASQDEYGQAGKKMPKLDQTEPDSNVDGRRFKVHIRDDGKAFVKINNYEWAEMWDGKPKSFDTYD